MYVCSIYYHIYHWIKNNLHLFCVCKAYTNMWNWTGIALFGIDQFEVELELTKSNWPSLTCWLVIGPVYAITWRKKPQIKNKIMIPSLRIDHYNPSPISCHPVNVFHQVIIFWLQTLAGWSHIYITTYSHCNYLGNK